MASEEFVSTKFLDDVPLPTQESFTTAPAGHDIIWRTYTTTDAFLLHSNPGVNHVIYLDFNGHTVAGTQWNTDFNSGNPFTVPAFSMDANRAAFSTAELNKIIEMWRMIAEDFMPFDIDVTTEDPGAANIIKTGPTDTRYGIRVVIGADPGTVVSGTPVPWPAAGGIAYINSFGDAVDQCCFVWNGDMSANPEYSLPVSTSHEVGHTMGLDHDGTATLGYYSGHGTGVTAWGPIMGAPFGPAINLTQWCRNTYPGGTNTEDDLAIITSHGFGYRPDDYGNAVAGAFALNAPLTATLNTTYGIIEQASDMDYFVFYANAGPCNITIDPIPVGPNLDIQADLYDAASNLISSSNGVNVLNANFALSLPSNGTYYLKIMGTGRANTGAPNFGYSNYGSLGSYMISGTVVPYTPPPPPPPPPPPGGGGNEGSVGGSGGTGGGAGEGSFGFGRGLGFASRAEPTGGVVLHGPDAGGEGAYRVINVSHRQQPDALASAPSDSGLAPVGWGLAAGLGLVLVTVVAGREGYFGFGFGG